MSGNSVSGGGCGWDAVSRASSPEGVLVVESGMNDGAKIHDVKRAWRLPETDDVDPTPILGSITAEC